MENSNDTEFELIQAGQVHLTPNLTKLVGAASLEAYTDFHETKNPNYTPPNLDYGSQPFHFLNRFTGFDDVLWGSGKEERYGLVYQWSAINSIYLIAFRGTSSVYDMVLDLESAGTASFKPHNNQSSFPDHIHVGDGFYKIYSTKNQTMSASMQNQVFDIIAGLPTPPSQIIITGHSLGCALASLFALDIAVSLPNVHVLNLNFASPRVGTGSWENAYNNTYGLLDKTVCIRNSYDVVPKVPPEWPPFDFRHIGREFKVSFGLKNYHWDLTDIIKSWHSLLNYRYVVDRAVANNPQIWTGEFTDQEHPSWEMISYDPNTHTSEFTGDDCNAVLEELEKAQKAS